jgi:pyruvate,water dikinase
MSVGVQKMVRPVASGVAFTLNPSNGDRSQVAIDASWGLGEPVVSGEVTPDNWLVDKVLWEITSRKVSNKTIELRVEGDALVRVDLTGERATGPCLTDAEIKAVARLARAAERHYGSPQDIEWALDSELESPENVLLLQSRPETVWSRKERPPVATSTNVMDSIVSTLCAPIHTRPQSAS